jgi:hypothetical protein
VSRLSRKHGLLFFVFVFWVCVCVSVDGMYCLVYYTEACGILITTSCDFYGGVGFEFLPADKLSWIWFIMVFLSIYKQMLTWRRYRMPSTPFQIHSPMWEPSWKVHLTNREVMKKLVAQCIKFLKLNSQRVNMFRGWSDFYSICLCLVADTD